MTTRKLKLGPLPEQSDDYSRYEETEFRWDRIAIFALGVVVLVFVMYQFFSSDDELSHRSAEPSEKQALVSATPATVDPVKKITAAPVVPEPIVPEPIVSAPEKRPVEMQESVRSAVPETSIPEIPVPASDSGVVDAPGSQVDEAQTTAIAAPSVMMPVISPVTKLHVGITQAELTSELKDGLPVAPLGYEVAMNDEGIIKVVLYTEMVDLKGTVLHHEWYRNEKRQARVKVPVNANPQRSSSSKFINFQMLGDWRVKVLDEQGELYAEANFVVK